MRHFPFHNHSIGEHRMIWVNGGVEGLQGNAVPAERGTIAEWRDKTPGAKEMFDFFQQSEMETIGEPDLEDYLTNVVDDATRNSTILYRSLTKAYGLRLDPKKNARDSANAEIQSVLKVLNEWIRILRESKQKRDEMVQKMKVPEYGTSDDTSWGNLSLIEWTKKGLGSGLSNLGKGFRSAKGSEKAIMLAGVGILVVTMVKSVKALNNTKIGNKWLKRAAWGAGALVTAEVLWRGYKHTSGGYKDAEIQKKKLLDETHEQLTTGLNIPDELLNEVMEGDQRYGLALANLTTLQVHELESLYENGRGSSEIQPDEPGYPKKMRNSKGEELDDGLTPSQRFFLVKELADTLGLLDASGNFSYSDPNIADQSVLDMAVSWEYPDAKEQYLHTKGLTKDPGTGIWEYNGSGITEYYFKVDPATNTWKWRYEDDGNWHPLTLLPTDYVAGDLNVQANEVGYPASYNMGPNLWLKYLNNEGVKEVRKIINDLNVI